MQTTAYAFLLQIYQFGHLQNEWYYLFKTWLTVLEHFLRENLGHIKYWFYIMYNSILGPTFADCFFYYNISHMMQLYM